MRGDSGTTCSLPVLMESTHQEAHRAVEIAKGFQLEQPRVFVSWDITHQELESLFQGLGLRRVGDGFHLSGCSSLGGLSHSLGFGFSRTGGKLSEIGLHVPGVSIEESYQQLQQHLIATFGSPTSSSWRGDGGMSSPHLVASRCACRALRYRALWPCRAHIHNEDTTGFLSVLLTRLPLRGRMVA